MFPTLGPFAVFIIITLSVLSILSWSIIILKWKTFREIEKTDMEFERTLEGKEIFPDAANIDLERSIRGRILLAGLKSFREYFPAYTDNPIVQPGLVREEVEAAASTALNLEMENLERFNVFLGTTATISPFLGLLGTVWGVMDAFMKMGFRGSSSIGIVGPGIAEALITTIVGLGVAIPAVVAYNHFSSRIKKYYYFLTDYVEDISSMALRAYIRRIK